MNKEFMESVPSLTESDLISLEHRVSRVVPAPYRRFLLEHNGGYPDPSDFVIKGRDGVPDLMGTVDRFLGVGMDDEHTEIERCLRVYAERVPPEYFPIAQDPGGNLICMVADGPDIGKIYFWDHEEEAEEGDPPSQRNLYFVADGLDAFLNHLQ